MVRKKWLLISSALLLAGSLVGCFDDNDSSNNNAANRVMLFTSNWGDDSIKVTDDLLSNTDGSTVTPDRVLIGASTQISNPNMDAIFVDESRNLIYLLHPDGVLVFENATTATGDIANDRIIGIVAINPPEGVEVDTVLDRLYVTGSTVDNNNLYIFDNASTLSGVSLPTETIHGIEGNSITLDKKNDRLFIGGDYNETIYVLDNASTLVSSDTVDRTIRWKAGVRGFNGPSSLWIDENNDRLYISSNWLTPGGNGLVTFENAATLSGSVDLDADSSMRISGQAITVMIDSLDNLYTWPDSPAAVKIYNNASALSGDVVVTPDMTIGGVVNSGYGMHALMY